MVTEGDSESMALLRGRDVRAWKKCLCAKQMSVRERGAQIRDAYSGTKKTHPEKWDNYSDNTLIIIIIKIMITMSPSILK